MNPSRFIVLLVFTAVFIALAGCIPAISSPTASAVVELIPYSTKTPLTSPLATPFTTLTPFPSSTPVTYTVAKGDTLTGIAGRFKISVESILAANPGVLGNVLSVGQTLVIPSESGQNASGYHSTPVPLVIKASLCRVNGNGTLCLVPVYNPYQLTMENIGLRVVALGENGQVLGTQDAFLLIDILPPGKTLAVTAFFEGIFKPVIVRSEVIMAFLQEAGDTRYVKTMPQNLLVTISWDGLTAKMSGKILVTSSDQTVSQLWLAAVAFDSTGEVIGIRRLELNNPLPPGSSKDFSMMVYSIGPKIDHVELVVEAKP